MPQHDHETLSWADSGSSGAAGAGAVSRARPVARPSPAQAPATPASTQTGRIVDATEAAAFFARVSVDLMEEPAEATTMSRIAERAVQVIPSCDHCSISVRRRHRRIESLAATSALAEQCDALQYSLKEGPCVEAVWSNDLYVIEDTAHDSRWPKWAPQVSALGVGSVLSVPLTTATETLGALNMYADKPNGFTRDDIDLAAIYAMHATNAMASALLVEGLQIAVQSRHLIGVAQGILMQNYGISMEQAFEVLRRCSSHRNIKLREVAEHIVERATCPTRTPRSGEPSTRAGHHRRCRSAVVGRDGGVLELAHRLAAR